jgi:DNA-binding response OmpR family regulator
MKTKKNVVKDIDEILIAEDSPTQAEQLKYILEKHKYKVRVAKDGKEAIGMVIEHSPSLVITDIQMPVMNGYDLCKEIKSREKTNNIPVILLTAFSRTEDVMEAISCGADNFLTKPFREDYLVSQIEQILSDREIHKSETIKVELEVLVGGKKRVITVDHQQILTLLISTYEAAVQRNDELVKAQDDLRKLNERLEELVTQRTAELSAEIAIRKSTEEALRESKEQHRGNLSQTTKKILP